MRMFKGANRSLILFLAIVLLGVGCQGDSIPLWDDSDPLAPSPNQITTNAAGDNSPPQVSAIGQQILPGAPEAPRTPLRGGQGALYVASAGDADGDPLSWEWLVSQDGEPPVSLAKGKRTAIEPLPYVYPRSFERQRFEWILRVNDGVNLVERRATVEILADPRGADLGIHVESADDNGLRLRVTPQITLGQVVEDDGETYTTAKIAEGHHTHVYGEPEIPCLTRYIAYPERAEVAIDTVILAQSVVTDVLLRPADPLFEDNNEHVPEPFFADPRAYASNAPTPSETVRFDAVGRIAGVPVGRLRICPASYLPSKRQLTIFEDLTVDVGFTSPFAPELVGHRDQFGLYAPLFLNGRGIMDKITPGANPPTNEFTDVEYLIITMPGLRSAAETLALWKNQKGIRTEVRDTTETGNTSPQLLQYILNAWNMANGSLRYLLFVGHPQDLPTWVVPIPANPIANFKATDHLYVMLDGSDIFPELTRGRIPAKTLAEAEDAVQKILDYEQTPSADPDFYDRLAFAGYFQDRQARATLEYGDLEFSARESGTSGNAISVAFIPPLAGPNPIEEVVTVNEDNIRIALGTDINGNIDTTADEIDSLVASDVDADSLVSVSPTGDGDEVQAVGNPTFLGGGRDYDGRAERNYVETLESLRDSLLGFEKQVDRIYTTESTGSPTHAGPEHYRNNTDIPSELLFANGSGFLWNGNNSDIQTSIDQGRSIVLHRGHGAAQGWADPGFTNNNIGSLSNGDTDPNLDDEDKLTVAFSLNCQTGEWDFDPVKRTLAETLLFDEDAGAASVLAPTRVTSSLQNNFLARAMFDAMYPSILDDFSVADANEVLTPASVLRLGDIMNYGESYVVLSDERPTFRNSWYLYHVFGDPTLEVWFQAPEDFDYDIHWSFEGQDAVLEVFVAGFVVPHARSVQAYQGDTPLAKGVPGAPSAEFAGLMGQSYRLTFPKPPMGQALDVTLYLTEPGARPVIADLSSPPAP